MRFIQFFKWWWDQNDEFDRTIACFGLFWAIPCAISSIWFGKAALIAILIGIPVVICCWLLYGISCWIQQMWSKFNDENPTPDIAII